MSMKLLQKTRVVETRVLTPRVRELVLEHQLRDQLQPFEAGAHVTLPLPGGKNRQYSLCGDPQDPSRYRLGVLLSDTSQGGSRAVHDLSVGDTLFVSYPGNSFALAADAGRVVLLAGGIGVPPILSMAQALAASDTPFEVHYGARSMADLVFADELRTLCPRGAVHFYAEDDPVHPRPGIAGLLAGITAGDHLYACGPSPMLDALMAQSKRAGLGPDQVHIEQFGAVAHGERQGDPFDIDIVGEPEPVTVSAHQSALEALRDAGHIVPSSCEGVSVASAGSRRWMATFCIATRC